VVATMGPPLQLLSRVQNATSRTPAIHRTECQAHCNHATHPRDLRRSIRRRLTGRCAVPVTPPESCSNFQLRTPVPPRAILCLISSSREMSREVPRKPVKAAVGHCSWVDCLTSEKLQAESSRAS